MHFWFTVLVHHGRKDMVEFMVVGGSLPHLIEAGNRRLRGRTGIEPSSPTPKVLGQRSFMSRRFSKPLQIAPGNHVFKQECKPHKGEGETGAKLSV